MRYENSWNGAGACLLTAQTAPLFLLDHGVISPGFIHEGVEVDDISRRNQVFRVRGRNGGVLLKQLPRRISKGRTNHLRREAMVLQAIIENVHMAQTRNFTPQVLGYYSNLNAIAIELVAPATTMTKVILSAGQFTLDPMYGQAIGEMVSTMHMEFKRALTNPRLQGTLRELPPLGLQAMSTGAIEDQGMLGEEFWNDLHETSLKQRVDEILEHWTNRGEFTHGDLRWDNILVGSSRNQEGSQLYLVDWEIGSAGDSAWDVATLLADGWRFVAICASNMAGIVEGQVTKIPFTIEDLSRVQKAIWSAYRDAVTPTQEFTDRVLMMVPVAILAYAWEFASNRKMRRGENEIPPICHAMVSMAHQAMEAETMDGLLEMEEVLHE